MEASFGSILIGWFQFRKKWNSIEIFEKVWLFLHLWLRKIDLLSFLV